MKRDCGETNQNREKCSSRWVETNRSALSSLWNRDCCSSAVYNHLLAAEPRAVPQPRRPSFAFGVVPPSHKFQHPLRRHVLPFLNE